MPLPPPDVSLIPAVLLAPLADLAALAEAEPLPRPGEIASALSVTDWVAATDRWGLPCLMSLPEPHLEPGLGDWIGTLIRVTPQSHALTPRGWVRLAGHATERDPGRVAAMLEDLEAGCAALRAALLAMARP